VGIEGFGEEASVNVGGLGVNVGGLGVALLGKGHRHIGDEQDA